MISQYTSNISNSKEKEEKIAEYLDREFSNSIFIIDEAHNLKSSMKQTIDP